MLRYLAKDMDNRLTTSASDIDSPKEKLIAVFNNQFEFFKKNPHFLVAIFSDGLLEESKAINEAILQIMGTKRKHLLQIIQQGQKQKQFTDTLSADELVHIIMGSFRLHMLQWRLSDFSFDLKSKGNKLVANLLTLIQPNTSLL